MTNSFYNSSGTPGTAAPLNSSPVRTEFALIGAAFDLFPVLAGNGGKAFVVNGSGTALSLTTGRLALGGNLTFLGTAATTFAAVAPVTLTLPSVGGVLMTLDGGTMTGVLNLVNGSSIPTAIAGTSNTQIASTAFVTGAVSSASSGDRSYTDTQLAANSTADRAYADGKFLPLTGGAINGSLSVTGGIVTSAAVAAANSMFIIGTAPADIFYHADAASGRVRGMMLRTSGSNRWAVAADAVSETGSSVGSDFIIYRYLDGAPTAPISALNISRASGDFKVSGALIVDAAQSGQDFQLWSTAVPPFARTVAFTAGGWMLQFNGQLSDLNYWTDPVIGASSPNFQSKSNGDFYVRGNVTASNIAAPSDERVKRDIEPYTRGLDDLIRLNPVIYSYNGLGGTTDDGTRRVGLGAQASRDIVPECVFPTPRLSAPRWNRDGSVDEWVDPVLPDQLSLDEKPILFAVINALKTLHERIQILEGKQ